MPCKITRAYKDVHRTIIFKGCSPVKDVTNASTSEPLILSKDRMHIVHSASLRMMDGRQFLYFAAKCHLEILTALGIFRSTKERRLHPGVCGRYRRVFFGRPYDELGYSYPWHRGEKTMKSTKEKKTIECCTEHFWYSSSRSQSNRLLHRWIRVQTPPEETSCPKTKWRKQCFNCLNYSQKMWSTTMQHISENLFQLKQMLEETLLRKHLPLSCNRCGRRPSR